MKHVLPQLDVKPSHLLHNIRQVLVKDNLFMCINSINVIYLQNYKLLTTSNFFLLYIPYIVTFRDEGNTCDVNVTCITIAEGQTITCVTQHQKNFSGGSQAAVVDIMGLPRQICQL